MGTERQFIPKTQRKAKGQYGQQYQEQKKYQLELFTYNMDTSYLENA